MTERKRTEEEWQTLRSSIEKAEGGTGFSTELIPLEDGSGNYFIVTDLDTNDKSLKYLPEDNNSDL